MTSMTFENTYTKYSFAPLVALALVLGRFVKSALTETNGNSADNIRGVSA
ncbi:hypothetical protein [Breoghania sp. L-A4]|nr:hypothetical protein [Breoghania sp. L-A4]